MSRSVRQEARAKAMSEQAALRRKRRDAERRKSALGVQVAVALEERDAAVSKHELEAGTALQALVTEEGVSPTSISDWVPGVSTSEMKRLRRLAGRPGDSSESLT